jgi:hypothetical protein
MKKKKTPKRPKDVNQLAKLVVDMATGEVEDPLFITMKADKRVLHSIEHNNGLVYISFTNGEGKKEGYGCGEEAFILLIEQHIKKVLESRNKNLETQNQKKKC